MALPIFFAHPPYAEDQTQSHAILTLHVLHRGFQSGAILAPIPYFLARRRERRLLSTAPSPTTSNASPPLSGVTPPRALSPALPTLLRSAGTSSVYATGLIGLGLVGRMWGREEIEWQDRSWRLLENKGQMECDVFSLAGTVAGLGAYGLAKALNGSKGGLRGWRVAVGAGALGNALGVGGYMLWRYGVKKGKWDEG